jgi:hypothetical protein
LDLDTNAEGYNFVVCAYKKEGDEWWHYLIFTITIVVAIQI